MEINRCTGLFLDYYVVVLVLVRDIYMCEGSERSIGSGGSTLLLGEGVTSPESVIEGDKVRHIISLSSIHYKMQFSPSNSLRPYTYSCTLRSQWKLSNWSIEMACIIRMNSDHLEPCLSKVIISNLFLLYQQ